MLYSLLHDLLRLLIEIPIVRGRGDARSARHWRCASGWGTPSDVEHGRLLAVTAAVAAGVQLCRALPGVAVGTRLDERVDRVLAMLPAATLAALLVVTVAGSGTGRLPCEVPAAMVVAAGVAALTRRASWRC